MKTHRVTLLILTALCSLAIGFVLGQSRRAKPIPTEVTQVRSITVEYPIQTETGTEQKRVRLAVNRFRAEGGLTLREVYAADSGKAPWKLTLDGLVVIATPD